MEMAELTFPRMEGMAPGIWRAALDPDTIRQIIGPGGTEAELEDLYAGRHPDKAVHAIMEDGVLGCITFSDTFRSSIGFWVRADMRRRGLVRKAWETLSPDYGPVYDAACWKDNAAARGLLEAIGFTLTAEGTSPQGPWTSYVNRTALRRHIEEHAA